MSPTWVELRAAATFIEADGTQLEVRFGDGVSLRLSRAWNGPGEPVPWNLPTFFAFRPYRLDDPAWKPDRDEKDRYQRAAFSAFFQGAKYRLTVFEGNGDLTAHLVAS